MVEFCVCSIFCFGGTFLRPPLFSNNKNAFFWIFSRRRRRDLQRFFFFVWGFYICWEHRAPFESQPKPARTKMDRFLVCFFLVVVPFFPFSFSLNFPTTQPKKRHFSARHKNATTNLTQFFSFSLCVCFFFFRQASVSFCSCLFLIYSGSWH